MTENTKLDKLVDPNSLSKGERYPKFRLMTDEECQRLFGSKWSNCIHCQRRGMATGNPHKGKGRFRLYVYKEDFRDKKAGDIVGEEFGKCYSSKCKAYRDNGMRGYYPFDGNNGFPDNGYRLSMAGLPKQENTDKSKTNKNNFNSYQNNIKEYSNKFKEYSNDYLTYLESIIKHLDDDTLYYDIDKKFLEDYRICPKPKTHKDGVTEYEEGGFSGFDCDLMTYLTSLRDKNNNQIYTRERVEDVFRKLGVRSGPKKVIRKGDVEIVSVGTVYLLEDERGRIRSGKIQYMDSKSGHRFKNKNYEYLSKDLGIDLEYYFRPSWLHCYTDQYKTTKRKKSCVFGLKYLVQRIEEEGVENLIVILYEAEKQVIYSMLECPEYVYISLGSVSEMKIEMIIALQRLGIRKVYISPDKGCYDGEKNSWKKEANKIETILNSREYLRKYNLQKIQLLTTKCLENIEGLSDGDDVGDLRIG